MSAARKLAVPSIDHAVWKDIHAAIQESCGSNILSHWLPQVNPQVRKAIEVFLFGRVADATIVMFDRTPMVRIILRHGGKAYKVDKSNPLLSLVDRFINAEIPSSAIPATWSDELVEHLLPILPQDLQADVMARIATAAAVAVQDPKKIGPIRARLNTRRAVDKERLMARIREVFHDHDDLVSEDEILQLWRETMCREVMDS